MDRRKSKTIRAIKDAFFDLIKTQPYSEISVQDILDKADIARATFYDHFKNKDEILTSISNGIFAHINDSALRAESGHDFSHDHDFEHRIIHLFYHLGEYNDVIFGILASESHDIFLQDLRHHADLLFSDRLQSIYTPDIPFNLYLNHATTSLTELILWWIKVNKCEYSPEQMAEFYFKIVPISTKE